MPYRARNPLLALAIALTLAAPWGGSAADASNPEVVDDGAGELGIPPELNVLSGWVGAETSTTFSLFMKIAALSVPAPGALHHYHFHFQVDRTDGNTSLYHGMVHHTPGGAWARMVERWIPDAGLGHWGATNETTGSTDGSTGVLEVVVRKGWVEAPRVDLATEMWTIRAFYIHADRVNASTQAIELSDSAPGAGTMGQFSVSVGAPHAPSSPTGLPALFIAVAIVAVAAAVLLVQRRK